MAAVAAKKRGPLFWFVWSVVATCVVTGISLALSGAFTRHGAQIDLLVTANRGLLSVDEKIAPAVQVQYEGRPVARLYLLSFDVANTGSEDIVGKSDVVEPLEVSLGGEAEILGPPTVRDATLGVAIVPQVDLELRRIVLPFDILYRGAQFSVDVFYTAAAPAGVTASGKIAGLRLPAALGGIRVSDATATQRRTPALGSFLGAALFGTVLSYLFLLSVYSFFRALRLAGLRRARGRLAATRRHVTEDEGCYLARESGLLLAVQSGLALLVVGCVEGYAIHSITLEGSVRVVGLALVSWHVIVIAVLAVLAATRYRRELRELRETT